ncbi:MAG: pyruvate kinase [Candidatus Parcubacteria bacterium]|jgi:pyruvate kinase|nr:MAG: hypothetical protein JST_2370 [Candidatus Parcubacteria bacterium]
MTRTKIIATVGPKTETAETLEPLLKNGVDMVRLNFSHATEEQYLRVQKIVKNFNKKNERSVSMMLDLQGPRIRVGVIPEDNLTMRLGEEFVFEYSTKPYEPGGSIPIDSKELPDSIKKGHQLFLANGAIELVVKKVKDGKVTAQVINSGVLSSHKGVNVPNTDLKDFGLTAKDKRDLKIGLKVGVDCVALSFVQTADDVLRLRKLIGKKPIKIISKIERGIALENINDIIEVSDIIMVARGDLGIEVPAERLPIIQKNLISQAHWHKRPAILATQVMTSMIKNPHPTRAEVSDIANAVIDGADMIMLSDETTVGNYPLEAVKMLKKVIVYTEESLTKKYF